MAVLNTTSPTERPGAPTEMPSKMEPSSRARIAGWVTGFALDAGKAGPGPAAPPFRGLQQAADAVDRSGKQGLRRAGILAASCRGSQRRPPPHGRDSAQQVGQAKPSRWPAGNAPGRMQGPAGEDVPVGRAVDQLEPLAQAGELDGVLADHIPRAQGGI